VPLAHYTLRIALSRLPDSIPKRESSGCPFRTLALPVGGSGSRFSGAGFQRHSAGTTKQRRYTSPASALPLLKPRLPAARSGAGTSSVRAPVEDSCCSAVESRRDSQRIARLVAAYTAGVCALGSGAAQPRRGTRRVALCRRRTAAQAGATARGNRNRKGSAHAQSGIAHKLFRMFQFHARLEGRTPARA